MSVHVQWVTNIPSPYRNHAFETMGEVFPRHDLSFEVLYMAWTEPDRHWRFADGDLRYPHHVFWGIQPLVGRLKLHFNPGLLSYLRRRRADIVVVGGWSAPTSILAPFACRPGTTKVLWSESNPESGRFNRGLVADLKRAMIRQYGAYIVPGQRSIQLLELLDPGVHRRPIVMLPNLINKAMYHDHVGRLRSRRRSIRAELGVSEGEKLWVCAARLEPFKGLHLFLPLFRGVANVRLLIAGEGSQKAALQAIIHREGLPARLIGQQTEADMVRLYAASDLFALPSLSDPSPLSPIEASAARLPLVVSKRAGNVSDLVVDGWNGWTYDPEDPEGFRNRIHAISRMSRTTLEKMGQRSLERYSERFDSERCIERLAADLLAIHRK